jgi:hypothetical protein
MKLLALFLLQGLHQKPNNEAIFFQGKILETPVFLGLFCESRFHLPLKFLHFADNEKGHNRETRYNYKNCRVALCATLFPTLPNGSQLLEV